MVDGHTRTPPPPPSPTLVSLCNSLGVIMFNHLEWIEWSSFLWFPSPLYTCILSCTTWPPSPPRPLVAITFSLLYSLNSLSLLNSSSVKFGQISLLPGLMELLVRNKMGERGGGEDDHHPSLAFGREYFLNRFSSTTTGERKRRREWVEADGGQRLGAVEAAAVCASLCSLISILHLNAGRGSLSSSGC